MEHLPFYISTVFVITAFFVILLLYKASNYSRPVLITILLWLALQSAVGLSGFYTSAKAIPPRFVLLILPPLALIAGLFFTGKGRMLMDGFDLKTLTLLHIVRIPVELVLFWLCLHKAVPAIMTFEGRNFDILSGLTAPFVYYFGFVKNKLGRNVLIGWNIICLLLLANIVITAVLSAPSPFQKFAFDQPNIAILHFPFIWLPCCIVPIVLLAHLVAIRQLVKGQSKVFMQPVSPAS